MRKNKAVYEALVTAASSVVVHNRGRQYKNGKGQPEYILATFHKRCKFGEGFPRPNVVSKQGDTITYRLNAVSLLNWLYKNGYAKYNVNMLVLNTAHFVRLEKKIDRMLEL